MLWKNLNISLEFSSDIFLTDNIRTSKNLWFFFKISLTVLSLSSSSLIPLISSFAALNL